MSRPVQLILLCEDKQHRVFLKRFFDAMPRFTPFRIEQASGGRGSAEQFVRKNFVKELRQYRHGHVNRPLVVMIDGDAKGVRRRLIDLDDACRKENIRPREAYERVAVFVPTWNIETWLAYLGGETVDESWKDYDPLKGKRERECRTHVKNLVDMCSRELRRPAPRSLVAACREYRRLEEKSRD